MAENLSKRLCTTIILSITIVALAGGYNHSRSTPEGVTATSKSATEATKGTTTVSDEIWPAMIGKQITIRGKLLLDKIGWYIALDNQQEVFFSPRSSTFGSYANMQDKLVTATGILRLFQCPKNPLKDREGRTVNKEGQVIDRCSDHYYFEAETEPQLLAGGK